MKIITGGMRSLLFPSSPPWRGHTGMLCPALGCSGQERHGPAAVSLVTGMTRGWSLCHPEGLGVLGFTSWNRGCTKGALSSVSMFQVGGNEEKGVKLVLVVPSGRRPTGVQGILLVQKKKVFTVRMRESCHWRYGKPNRIWWC